MQRTNSILIFLCVILLAGTGVVLWQLWAQRGEVQHVQNDPDILLGLSTETTASSSEDGLQASNAILYSTDTNSILFEKNAFERRPIASITKLMTAMVALDYGIAWDAEANILPGEYVQGGELILAPGETVTMRDLFNASLLGSANNATLAYVRQLGVSHDDFVQAMNRKAVELQLEQTEFTDVTGLSPSNVSTAYETAMMAHNAFTKYPAIARATSQKEYTFIVRGSGREHTIHNTNKSVLTGDMDVIGSKTGFLYEAGYCLVVEGANKYHGLVAVVMNTPSEQGQFFEISRLLNKHGK